jgi:hypothetical protein
MNDAEEMLVWTYVPEADHGAMDPDAALKLAHERLDAKNALKLANVRKAAKICTDATVRTPEMILKELGF